MSYYRDFPDAPKPELKRCPKCGWMENTNLFNCYKRSFHNDSRPCALEKVE